MRIQLILLLLGMAMATADTIVQTSKGQVRGVVMETFNNKTFYAFMGIPFAKPPIGDLRYQAPQSPDPWEGVFDDRGVYRQCITDLPTIAENETEDCLYLHVYTPQLPSKEENVSLPVMFYIHGGGFVEGSANVNEFGPHYLIDYDIIVVFVAYRLGFLGFVSTGDLNCPGNNGLKDQLLGLKWVQENIRQFGGDPEKVTIFGESAGAASVGHLLLSPQAAGLFRGAIQDSGSTLNSWLLQRDPKKITYAFAKAVDPSVDDNTSTGEIMDIFRNLTLEEIKSGVNAIFGSGYRTPFFKTMNGFVFSGVIEPKHNDAFLDDYPYGKMVSGNFNIVPTLIGINSQEALFIYDDKLIEMVRLYDDNPEMFVSPDMHITDLDLLRSIGQDIRRIYVNSSKLHENVEQSITFVSDIFQSRSSLKQASLESSFTDVFFYEYAYLSSTQKIPGRDGVPHAAELKNLFFFNWLPNPNTLPQADITTMKRLQTMWTNFVKFLNPTPKPQELLQNIIWPTTSPELNMPYLCINETLEVRYNLKKPMVDEYARLYNTYAVPPLDVY